MSGPAVRGVPVKLDVAAYLAELATQGELFFKPNAGNAGDSLIACATFQLFDEANISYRLFDEDAFDPAGKILIYGGGGNLVAEHKAARQFVERYHHAVKKLVILPHTVSGNEGLLGRLGSNVDIITREAISFEYVERQAPYANVLLADDLAFKLNLKLILAAKCTLPYRQVPLKRVVRRDTALWQAALRRSLRKTRVLNCFRTDKERTNIRRPVGNVDLSKLLKYGVDTPEEAFRTTQVVFRFVNQYDEIRTNRLHVAIAGALLGKVVKFYSNSYFKNKAVYDFSMKDHFPNVQWMGAD